MMLAGLLVGCSSTGVVRTALYGDLPSLREQIERARARGELGRSRVTELARAVAARELRSAQGEVAVRRVQQLRPCAHLLLHLLVERARQADDAAAEATRLLFELGELEPERLAQRYARDRRGAWRAVAARATTSSRLVLVRRSLLLDPDRRVRRAAAEAALVALEAGDLPVVLERTRLDPDPVVRGLAARVAGLLGGARAVLTLRDIWARADDDTRLAIIEAWAAPQALTSGGLEQLVAAAEGGSDVTAAAAAVKLAQRSGPEAELGRAVLLRLIAEGSDQAQTLAIQGAPLPDPEFSAVLRRHGEGKSGLPRVLSLTRLAEQPTERDAVLPVLRQIAQGHDLVAREALRSLVMLEDHAVTDRLRADLRAQSSRVRQLAATGLARLGDWAAAASALADDDPRVRAQVACAMLTLRPESTR